MSKLKYFFGCLAGPLFIGMGFTSISYAESLRDIHQSALKSDPTYLAGLHQNKASSEAFIQGRAVLLPSIDLDYRSTNTTQNIKSSDNAVFASGSTSFPTTEYEITISQSIYSYARWAKYRQAKSEVRRAAAELTDVEQALALRVSESYFAVLAEQESHDYIQAEKNAIKKHFDLVRAKHRDGLARITDLAQAEARYMSVLADEIEIRNSLDDSVRGVQEITGSVPAGLMGLADTIPMTRPEPADTNAWVKLAKEQNPGVLIQRSVIDIATEEIKQQQGNHYPTLDLLWRTNRRETEGSLFGGGSDVETQDLVLELNIPIYAGGAVSSKVTQADQMRQKARQELEVALRSVDRETLAAYQGVVGAIARVKALEKSIQAHELTVRSKTTAYDSGLTTSLSVLDATRDLYLARRDFAQARHDYILNTLRLKRMVGALTGGDLEKISSMLN